MKPEWCEKLADEAAEAYHKWLHGTRLKHSTPELSRFIARALLDAHQRGRREGMEEAAKVARKMLVYADTTSEADVAIPAAIRAKAQEATR